nr:hypothetical protein [Tanacetum cinerariifolium]
KRILKKKQKHSPKRQNQTQEWKRSKKTKSFEAKSQKSKPEVNKSHPGNVKVKPDKAEAEKAKKIHFKHVSQPLSAFGLLSFASARIQSAPVGDPVGGEEVFVAGKNENVVEEVVNAAKVSTAATTATITTEENTLAQELVALKTSKPKDKGKGIMIEEPVKPKKKDQIKLDEEAALKLQAEFDEEERLARERAKEEQEANIALIETWMIFKQRLMLIINEEEVSIDVIPLAVKSPRIVDWKIHKEGKKSYYQIVRADGKSQMYMIFCQMLKSFDREDLEDLYKLVKARYGSTRPVENMNYLLWSDMKTMFKPYVEDDSMQIYMLVEKKYPLTPHTLTVTLEKKLQIEYEIEMAYQLCRLIKKQLKNEMHNNIMVAGSRDRPPMLETGRYAQWRSRFLQYIDTRPNGDALKKCILEGPYTPTTVVIQAVPATENSPAIPEHTTVETILNMSPENKAHSESEKEAIHLILTRIRDEIYSIVDACNTAHEMWEAIERSHATRRHKGKEIVKPITPPSESASKEDSDPEQVQKDKEMQKNLALIPKYFKKIYKPTNNNLKTSSNTRNKNVDTTPRYKNDNQTGQFGNQRTMTADEIKETVCGQVVQQTGIQCFNCKEFVHFAKECRKPKRVNVTPLIFKRHLAKGSIGVTS